MNSRHSRQFLWASCAALWVVAAAVGGCRRKEPDAPPVATPSVALSHDKAPLASPIDITYKFVVANDAHFDQDYRVMMHVVDADEEMIWTDDHNPPVPTSQWKSGQTIEYTRTIFVPVYPYVGEASIQIGLYSTASQKRLPLSGETRYALAGWLGTKAKKAICLSSGDQRGSAAYPGRELSWSRSLPSLLLRHSVPSGYAT